MTTDRSRHRPTRWGAVVLVLLLAVTAACGSDDADESSASDPTSTTSPAPATVADPEGDDDAEPTIVLVHGAFAGPASWDGVVPVLEAEGHDVVVPELPLRSVAGDTEELRGVLDEVEGPVVLVAHSYGGIIATGAAVDDPQVEALVYVAAFVPDEGESIIGLLEEYPGSAAGPDAFVLEPYTRDDGTEGTDAHIRPEVFADVFAADLPEEAAADAAAAQHPVDFDALGEEAGPPAWASIPSWYLISTADQLIPVEATRAMAERAGSETVEVDASHAVLISQPDTVVDIIDDALTSVG